MDSRAQAFYASIESLYANTPLQPLALAVTLCMGLLLLVAPRRWAVVPIFVVMLAIPSPQRIVVSNINFDMMRIILLFGWARVILKRETWSWKATSIDFAAVAFGTSQVFFYVLQRHSAAALVSSLGTAFDFLGTFFLFRVLIVDFPDASVLVRVLGIFAIPIAFAMIAEQQTGRNLFSIFGGVPVFTEFRGGRFRSQASFMHPILAGTFGATLFPLLASGWRMGSRFKRTAIAGTAAAVVITYASSSSGPLFALITGALGMAMYRFSTHMRTFRRLALLGIIGLQLLMKSPIYFLISRMPLMAGSTAYYRSALIQAFITHFPDWMLFGVPSTAYWGEGLFDITNQYIRVAVNGGLTTLMIFLGLIVITFRDLGRALGALKVFRKKAEWLMMWGLGVALLTHIVSFISVSYFDNTKVLWYMVLALIATLAQNALASASRQTTSVLSLTEESGFKTYSEVVEMAESPYYYSRFRRRREDIAF